MKNRITIALLPLFLLTACSSEENFDNKLFLDTEIKSEVRVAVDEKIESMKADAFKVCIARPLSKDVEVSFSEAPEMLDTYREAYYDEDAVLLPDGHCDISAVKAVIKAGMVKSDDILVPFEKLGKGQGLDYSKKYVLPVTVNAEGVDILPRMKTMFFVVRKAALVNVTADMKSNCAWPEWGNFNKVREMEHFTMEALVNAHAFDNKSKVHTIMGIEENFLIRVGDDKIAANQIQIAVASKDEDNNIFTSKWSNTNLQLKAGQWYHIALTFDGGESKTDGADIKLYINGKEKLSEKCVVKDGNTVLPINKVNFMIPHSDESDGKPRCFWVGYSYDGNRSFNGVMSEVRLWNKALTEEEINAPSHFYKLYRDDKTGLYPEELIAYWKFDDGKGKIVKDYSSSAMDLTGNQDFVWYSVDLPLTGK